MEFKLSLLAAARALAFLDHRNHVLPEDVQAVFAPVASHRLMSSDAQDRDGGAVDELLAVTPVP